MSDNITRPSAVETVIIRDWRFRRQIERTASGAGRMEIEDNGKIMRLDFFPKHRTDLKFLHKTV